MGGWIQEDMAWGRTVDIRETGQEAIALNRPGEEVPQRVAVSWEKQGGFVRFVSGTAGLAVQEYRQVQRGVNRSRSLLRCLRVKGTEEQVMPFTIRNRFRGNAVVKELEIWYTD